MDWCAGLLELVGIWVIGNKSRWGFIIMIASASFWCGYVWASGAAYGILPVVIVATILNIRNFIKWSKK